MNDTQEEMFFNGLYMLSGMFFTYIMIKAGVSPDNAVLFLTLIVVLMALQIMILSHR